MQNFLKRLFDILVSLLFLIVASPLFLMIGILIKADTSGPVFYRQTRVGRHFKHFRIYKFRTMFDNADETGPLISSGNDKRITVAGRLLRKYKLDELPQFINVLKGEMSIVGPRPEVPKYVEAFRKDYSEILSVKPGITDLASIKYVNENSLLDREKDPENYYLNRILPEKIKYYKLYLNNRSLGQDFIIIFKTVFSIMK